MASIEYVSPRLTLALVDDVHIAVHGQSNPDPIDWEAYLRAVRKVLERYPNVKGIVYTYGGNPSSAQRSELNKISEGLLPRVSVMVESRVARGAVTALSWFNPSIKAFSLEQIDEALEHLEISGVKARQAKEALAQLKTALREAGG